MSFRQPTYPQKTDWARFIVRRRRELDWSATQAFEKVQPYTGYGTKSRSAYLKYEEDKEPDEKMAAVFRKVFGGEPEPRDRVSAPAGAPDLASTLRDVLVANAKLHRDYLTVSDHLAALMTVAVEALAPLGFDIEGRLRAAVDDLQARRQASNGPE